MEIRLPILIGDGRIDTILKIFEIVNQERQLALRLNWKDVQAVSPAGFAILTCLFDSIVERKANVQHLFVKKKIREIPIVEKIIRADRYAALPEANSLSFSYGGTLIQGQEKGFALSFPEQLVELNENNLSEEQQFSIKLILNELMINTVDHSTSERYFLYGGTWKREFHTGVLDMGVTIPAKLEQKYSFQDDTEALRLSLKEGVTTRRMRAGGLGLYNATGILNSHQGRLTLVSRSAQLRKYFQRRRTEATLLKHPLQGTWCFARIPRFYKGKAT